PDSEYSGMGEDVVDKRGHRLDGHESSHQPPHARDGDRISVPPRECEETLAPWAAGRQRDVLPLLVRVAQPCASPECAMDGEQLDAAIAPMLEQILDAHVWIARAVHEVRQQLASAA